MTIKIFYGFEDCQHISGKYRKFFQSLIPSFAKRYSRRVVSLMQCKISKLKSQSGNPSSSITKKKMRENLFENGMSNVM